MPVNFGAFNLHTGWRGIAATLLAYVLFSLLQRYLSRYPILKAVSLQLNLFVLALALMLFLSDPLARIEPGVLTGVRAAAVFLALVIGLRLGDRLYFEVVAPLRRRAQVPVVLRDLSRWTISLVALVLIVRAFFPTLNLNVLAVSSLVVGYVVGNATQDTLGNLIAGLALNTERPFQIGDWVTVGGHTGRVVDTTWRATRLRTKTEDHIVIPNATIAREPIANFSRPTTRHGCAVTLGVAYETPPNHARAVILNVLRDIPEVCREPAPSVWLSNYGDFSINFTVKYFIDDFARLDAIQTKFLDRIWYAFGRAQIEIPFPVHDVRMHPPIPDSAARRQAEAASIRQTLQCVDLFQSLSPPELDQMAGSVRRQLFGVGEALCRQGDEGDTLYVIGDGSVAVTVRLPDGRDTTVAHLGAKAFFGEMSLLTGEKRSATVSAERDTSVLAVSKDALSPLLQSNADLASRLATALEQRTADRHAKMTADSTPASSGSAHSALVDRIRRFFGAA